jgi:hypothetical protein
MFVSAHIQDVTLMLASANTQNMTICWLVHACQDNTLASAHKTGPYVGQCTYTRCDHRMLASARIQDVTICWLMHAGQDITLASTHAQDGHVAQVKDMINLPVSCLFTYVT